MADVADRGGPRPAVNICWERLLLTRPWYHTGRWTTETRVIGLDNDGLICYTMI